MNQKPDRIAITAKIIEKHKGKEGSLLPILHDLQEEFGFIPEETLPQVAKALLISKAEIWGVVTFYHDFKLQPAGRNRVKICRAEACQAMGGEALAQSAKRRLSLDWHQTSPDGRVTLEPVFCLGLCACAPAAMVNGQLSARLTEDKLFKLIEGLS